MYMVVKTLIDDGLMRPGLEPFVTFVCIVGLALWGISIIGGGDSNDED